MAKSPNGPHGNLIGKVGNLVHYMLKGQNVVRTVGAPSKHRSTKQKANQQAMTVLMDALRPALRFINAGFELKARNTVWNPHNLAVSYNKKHALQDTYPKLRVDYSKLCFSQGSVPMAKDLHAQKEAGGIRISWNPTLQHEGDWNDDIVMVMALFPGKERAEYQLNAGLRVTGNCLLALPQNWLDQQMEIYLVFKSSDGTGISDTAHIGSLNAPATVASTQKAQKKVQVLKANFKAVEATYFRKIKENNDIKPQTRAFRRLEKEYEILRQKVNLLSGEDV